ncbi:MAG: NADPH-dependent F420 reductase [Chloroflexota bacterium]|nr:NADPH-dependent F420 reductase [Chloroflexota bacterium]
MPNHPITQSPNFPITQSPILAIIGGTGKEGNALAFRFAKAGVNVIIGSRDAAKGDNAAREMNARFSATNVTGTSNRDAAAQADIILLAVPYDGMKPILEDIRDAAQNKIVINIASSLDPERKSRAKPPAAGSVTAEVQQFFGDTAKVVCAFQNISPEKLESVEESIDTDVIVCGGDRAAREIVIALIRRIGIDAFDGGVLANAVAVEALTAVLIAVNIKYKVKGAGIRLTGVPRG